MSKKIFFKVGVALVLVAAAVVWLLSVVMPDKFKNVNLSWVIAAACGAVGLLFVLRGIFSKTLGIAKKFYIFVGAAFFIAAALALVGTFLPKNTILPIVAIIIAVAALFSIFVVGGKKWDTADNEKVGYKNYYQRKEEEEKKAAKEAEKKD